ncbi:MAG TPA: 4-alpha-glucanotransferase [Patescibacteria group bacterium]|nr:4-alpha-glucanotransferase [Patescibacteria group bacterium]
MKTGKKIIGTFVPIGSLLSNKLPKNKRGTFEEGLIFLDWLKKTNQSAWQFLPLHETYLKPGSTNKHSSSPYDGYSIGFDPIYLPKSYKNITPTDREKSNFVKENKSWILDYALFCALRDHFKTDDWKKWKDKLRNRDRRELKIWEKKLKKEINKYIIMQWQLNKAFIELKAKSKKLGIILIGDMPFYVSRKSPLVWANQNVFNLEDDGSLNYVSGVISDDPMFGRQVWGHPLYNWDDKKRHKEIIGFWKNRVEYASKYFDIVRIDHAIAFFDYGKMHKENEDKDIQKKGPGEKIFRNIINFGRKHNLSFFVEDQGDNVEDLRKAMKKLKVPGIKILRMGILEKENKFDEQHLNPKKYGKNTVAYTTTHDTETLLGFLSIIDDKQKRALVEASNLPYERDDNKLLVHLRNSVINSPAKTVIIPIQDFLGIKDRINVPGTTESSNNKNWKFRIPLPIEELPTNIFS